MKQQTFCMIKPGITDRKLVGNIITRIEQSGLDIIALKMFRMTEQLARTHYAEHTEKPFFPDLLSYICSGVVVGMVVSGEEAIKHIRRLTGATNPMEASPGTIRGDLALETTNNVIHASDSEQSAQREIGIFFTTAEIFA